MKLRMKKGKIIMIRDMRPSLCMIKYEAEGRTQFCKVIWVINNEYSVLETTIL